MENLRRILDLKELLFWVETNLIRVIIGILLIVFYRKILLFLVNTFDKILLKKMENGGLRTFLKSSIRFIAGLILIVVILNFFGINLTSLFTILGAVSVAIGFSFKEIISNVFGGIIILVFKPFKIDDVIEHNGYIGVVNKIEIFYTKIINIQNETVIIPNGLLITNEIKNITMQNKRRLDLKIGVAYESNISIAKKILEEVVKNSEYVMKDEDYTIGVLELADSSINFCVNVYVIPENYLKAKLEIFEEVIKRFNEENISIPFNQLDVHLINKGENYEN